MTNQPTSIVLDEPTKERIAAHVRRLADKNKTNISRAQAIRSLIEAGLRESERRR
jgi:hypothetical protein